MNPPREGTLPDLLLIAAAASLHDVWTLEDLAIHAHLAFPDRFAMWGHAELPCTHRVHSVVYGARGLIARQLVEEANGVNGHPFFRLTELGHRLGERRRQKQTRDLVPRPPPSPIRPLAPLAPEPVAEPAIYPTVEELNLWRIGKQGQACLQLMTRCKERRQLVSGRKAKEVLELADEVSGAAAASGDCVLVVKRENGR